MDGRDKGRTRIFGPAPSRKTLEIKSSRPNVCYFILNVNMASGTVSQQVPGPSTHSATDTVDPITKFKLLVPRLKESLQVLYKGLSKNRRDRTEFDQVYRHFGPKTLWTQDISALGPKCKNPRHFGTSAEVPWTFRHHL